MNLKSLLRGLGVDVGLPLVAYYALHLLGVSEWRALLASTLVAGVRIVWVAVRDRSLNLFATVMLLVFGLGLVVSFVSGDPRFLVVKESFVTGAVGLTFLITARGKSPLTLAAQKSWEPGEAAALDGEYRTDADVRHGHRFTSTVWRRVGLLAEAAIRVPLAYLLPINVMVGLSTVMLVAAFVGLGV